jgi:hypothetical protein
MTQHYRFCAHVHHALVGEQLILLDGKQDKYIFIDGERARTLHDCLESGAPDALARRLPEIIRLALQQRIIEPCNQPYRLHVRQTQPVGIDLHQWRLPAAEAGPAMNTRQALPFIGDFLRLKLCMRIRGLDFLFRRLHAATRRRNVRLIPFEEVETRCRQIRQAALYLPFRTACLENALVTAFYLARHAIPGEFCIGIQLTPFLAHAWINYQGRVILDKPDLNQAMITLLKIPGGD